MTEPDTGTSGLGAVLCAISKGYAAVIRWRNRLYDRNMFRSRRLDGFVISIGNITMGGTGKTPMTIYLARLLKRAGCNVVILSRGYRGEAENIGGIVSDGSRLCMTPTAAGDEPYMMAASLKNVPVLVGRDRFENGRLAVDTFSPDVILLDDAFQHRKLARDMDLVLLDGSRPLGNGRLFPGGVLREPPESLKRADACILTRWDPGTGCNMQSIRNFSGKAPVFKTRHVPCIHKVVGSSESRPAQEFGSAEVSPEILNGRRAFAFSGIARNSDFLSTVKGFGCRVVGSMPFQDHHWYSETDRVRIAEAAYDAGADLILTTEKDYVRIACPVTRSVSWPVPLVVIGIDISFDEDEERFVRFIMNQLPPNHKT